MVVAARGGQMETERKREATMCGGKVVVIEQGGRREEEDFFDLNDLFPMMGEGPGKKPVHAYACAREREQKNVHRRIDTYAHTLSLSHAHTHTIM